MLEWRFFRRSMQFLCLTYLFTRLSYLLCGSWKHIDQSEKVSILT